MMVGSLGLSVHRKIQDSLNSKRQIITFFIYFELLQKVINKTSVSTLDTIYLTFFLDVGRYIFSENEIFRGKSSEHNRDKL